MRPAIADQTSFVSYCIRDCCHYASDVFNQNRITKLLDRIGVTGRSIFVACIPTEKGQREPVGVVIITPSGRSRELCWAVSPEHRRRGLGSRMVALAAQHGDVAQIESADQASAKIARRTGFDLVNDGPVQLWRADRIPPYT